MLENFSDREKLLLALVIAIFFSLNAGESFGLYSVLKKIYGLQTEAEIYPGAR